MCDWGERNMKILVTDKLADEAIDLMKKKGHEVTFEEMNGDPLLKVIGDYDALLVRSGTKVTTDIVKAGAQGNLKVIGRAGIGVDNIDIKTAAEQGIKVVNSPTGATISVAELTIAHMLSLYRHLTKADRTMKEGEWAKKQLKGLELHGKTVGLIGSGNIAQHVAKLANAFGMKVLVYSPHCTEEKARKMGAENVDIDDLLKQSDFVSLHIPHTSDTHYFIDEDRLGLMKSSACLINCARGGVVDESALFAALKEKRIAGAALDVYEEEPPGKTPLINLENVVCTPHLGATTKEGQIRAGTICAEQVLKVLNDEEPDFWVNKKHM